MNAAEDGEGPTDSWMNGWEVVGTFESLKWDKDRYRLVCGLRRSLMTVSDHTGVPGRRITGRYFSFAISNWQWA